VQLWGKRPATLRQFAGRWQNAWQSHGKMKSHGKMESHGDVKSDADVKITSDGKPLAECKWRANGQRPGRIKLA